MYISEVRFSHLFDTFERSAFRLQLLSRYDVESERDEYAHFLAGEPLPTRGKDPWIETMRRQVVAGRAWTNVHLLPLTLTPYLGYLIDWRYVFQDEAGAAISFLPHENANGIRALASQDFWLFDESLLVVLHYDPDGRFLGAVETAADAALSAAGRARAFAMTNAVSLRSVLANRRNGTH